MNLVVSPHLDDAVLSYGGFMSWSPKLHKVLTVLAGLPPHWYWPTPFDNACGFHNSRQAVLSRRLEDVEACDQFGATAVHLDFLDGQYGINQHAESIPGALHHALQEADEIAVPLGIGHPDHVIVARCCSLVLRSLQREFTVYADLPGAVLSPPDDLDLDLALHVWELAGWELEPIEWDVDLDGKRVAWERYGSQLHLPELAWENLTEEHGWRASIAV